MCMTFLTSYLIFFLTSKTQTTKLWIAYLFYIQNSIYKPANYIQWFWFETVTRLFAPHKCVHIKWVGGHSEYTNIHMKWRWRVVVSILSVKKFAAI